MKKILVTIYLHPEYYPPTLNAIHEFSLIADEVIVVTRNMILNEKFPENVVMKLSGNYISLTDSMQHSFFKKIKSFLEYLKLLYNNIKVNKPDLVVAHDPIALFSYWILNKTFNNNHLVWYHNHDVTDINNVRKFSISWFAAKYEKRAFKIIDILTLPAEERKVFFPINRLKGKYYFMPNLPTISFYKQFYMQKQKPDNEIKLLYQGVIREEHGLEEIIAVLNYKVLNSALSITLLGEVKDNYKEKLMNLAKKYNVIDKLHFLPRESYSKLPFKTVQYDIGLAIHKIKGIQYSTAGTASNKIYEYAALGLPVILFDHKQYRKYLEQYKWAFFTSLNSESIIYCIEEIINNYQQLSILAHKDFLNRLNFEKKFKKIIGDVLKKRTFINT